MRRQPFGGNERVGVRIVGRIGHLKSAFEPGRGREPFLAQKRRIEKLALVSGAVIAKDRDDRMPGAEFLGQADGARDVDAAGPAKAQALMLQKIEELTLYILELNKEIENLKQENHQIRTLLEEQK